ncbi:LmbE family N-acetylglucosaminyl deacetylase [Paraburkholderia bannensis]|uniref:LmbE family N-acetylglucosaminyl deacetylase n=1 Tax=Paraburkholderia bannensis TaxID=765414 RepID=A0A7W9WS85_9BURK|nr:MULTISPECIES: PIG-L family deacetylase [Paraburkholderia]MBB3257335.1 LmbE family N-acetylglucosaminyl deacetylase [Paraburkholderia sp. WP4_3_2]MBB6102269.1 LmbE family N-acetylglucosaminyl deacetylase [Paraburkholderia bannensis]
MASAGVVAPLFVVSPHLDDAVFSCGSLLAARRGAVVCTVFAGTPADPVHRSWDEAAGFEDSTQAMHARTLEDEYALSLCEACGVRLGFFDGQYAPLPAAQTVARAIAEELARWPGATPVVPLGLRHSDHRCVADAWLVLFRARSMTSCIVYEEAIHRTARDLTGQRLAELANAGLSVERLDEAWCPARTSARAQHMKRRCVQAYASQLRAFGARIPADLGAPEQYWRVEWARRTGSPLRGS